MKPTLLAIDGNCLTSQCTAIQNPNFDFKLTIAGEWLYPGQILYRKRACFGDGESESSAKHFKIRNTGEGRLVSDSMVS
ncbi:hypothetical protein N5K13_29790 [Sphingobium yanoikuyae]|nr:hypothetical protein [Sphingobium yanoikuyae]MDH2170690.1 hypothetical protein [Sphingobium yanoikuyae]